MNSSRLTRMLTHTLLAAGVVLLASGVVVMAQVTSQTTVTQGQSTSEVKVEHGEVLYVSGNQLVVKNTDTGEVKTFNVPDSARVNVDGQELSVHDLKPGMKLQRTITTTTTPKTVKTVRTVQGRVWQVNAPLSVILTMADGKNKQFRIPEGQKFSINGQEVDSFHLKKGMTVSATVITEAPETEIAEHRTVTGEMPAPPPPPETPPMVGVLLIEVPAPQPETTASAQPAPKLPQTAGFLPLMGLLGTLLSGVGVGLRFRRS